MLVVIGIGVGLVSDATGGRPGPSATVTGRLLLVGGPIGARPEPLSGQVTFTGTGMTGDTFSVTTNSKGL